MRTPPQAIGRKTSTRHTSRTVGRRLGSANRTSTATTDTTHMRPTRRSSPGGTHSSMRRADAVDEVTPTYS